MTPKIATASWPQEVELLAVERVQAMIDSVWPGDTDRRRAICADWLDPPFADMRFDLAIGDGCLTAVGFPDELSRLLASVHRCLRRDGYLMLRLFCRPDVPETPDAVIAALREGRIGGSPSSGVSRWRYRTWTMHPMLWSMKSGGSGTRRGSICASWRIRGWPPKKTFGRLSIIAALRRATDFMRLGQATRHLQRAGFDLLAARTAGYELAERCPHVLLRKRSPAGAS